MIVNNHIVYSDAIIILSPCERDKNELEADIKKKFLLYLYSSLNFKKEKIPKTKKHFIFGNKEKILLFVNYGLKIVI